MNIEQIENSLTRVYIEDVPLLLSTIEELNHERTALEALVKLLTLQRDTAREALRKYGRCLNSCATQYSGELCNCTCGFTAALSSEK